jgi:hypothetical protein
MERGGEYRTQQLGSTQRPFFVPFQNLPPGNKKRLCVSRKKTQPCVKKNKTSSKQQRDQLIVMAGTFLFSTPTQQTP